MKNQRFTVLFEKRDKRPWVVYDRIRRNKISRFEDRKMADREASDRNKRDQQERDDDDIVGTFFG